MQRCSNDEGSTWLWAVGAAGTLVLASAAVIAPTTALGEPPPPYDGLLAFPAIHGPSDPEEYSWTVELQSEQELDLIDEQHAAIFFEDLAQPAAVIPAPPAHDANGATAPTSLAISEGDVVTLTVHHRAGNVAAGGAPFAYPISWGMGWGGGFHTVITVGPKDEAELREERERIERERFAIGLPGSKRCFVPKLDGMTLKRSKQRLKDSGCEIGKVTKLKGATARTGRTVRQSPEPGRELKAGAAVNVTLARP